MSIILNRNDYDTELFFDCRAEKSVIILTGIKPFFEMHSKHDGRRICGGECEYIDLKLGQVKFRFKEPDLEDCGFYQGKLKLDMGNGITKESLAMEIQII